MWVVNCYWLAFLAGPLLIWSKTAIRAGVGFNAFAHARQKTSYHPILSRGNVVWWPDTDDIELEQREPIWHIGAFACQDSFWNTIISPARWKGNSTRKRLNAKCVYFYMQIGDTVKINISKTAHVWKTYKNKVVNTGTCFSVAISYIKLKLLSVIKNHFSYKIISFSCNLSYISTASPTRYTGNIYIYLA